MDFQFSKVHCNNLLSALPPLSLLVAKSQKVRRPRLKKERFQNSSRQNFGVRGSLYILSLEQSRPDIFYAKLRIYPTGSSFIFTIQTLVRKANKSTFQITMGECLDLFFHLLRKACNRQYSLMLTIMLLNISSVPLFFLELFIVRFSQSWLTLITATKPLDSTMENVLSEPCFWVRKCKIIVD